MPCQCAQLARGPQFSGTGSTMLAPCTLQAPHARSDSRLSHYRIFPLPLQYLTLGTLRLTLPVPYFPFSQTGTTGQASEPYTVRVRSVHTLLHTPPPNAPYHILRAPLVFEACPTPFVS